MITLQIEPQDLYNLIFDMGRSDREYNNNLPDYLIDQIINEPLIKDRIHWEETLEYIKLWRLDAWKRSGEWILKSREKSHEDTRKWNLMKSAAKVCRKKLGNMEFDACFLLVQNEVRNKRWVILKACGVDVEGEEWKGLVELPDGKEENLI